MKSWPEWATHHGMLFALISDREMLMLKAWSAQLKGRGWTPDEAWEASDWISRNNPPRMRAGHLKALQDRLPVARREREKSGRPAEEDQGQCVDCRDTGLAWVPSRRPDADTGEWRMPDPLNRGTFYTMVVACHCALGHWRADHCVITRDGKENRILSFEEYEMMTPGWREELRDYEQSLRRSAGTLALTREIDDQLGEIGQLTRQVGVSVRGLTNQERQRLDASNRNFAERIRAEDTGEANGA